MTETSTRRRHSRALLQRTGLTLDAGRVVFGMGGNSGDCGPYRGRVVSVAETGGKPSVFTVDAAAGEREGRSGWGCRTHRRQARAHLGRRGERLGDVRQTGVRPQRCGPRALIIAAPAAVLRAEHMAARQRQRPRCVDGTALLADGQVVGSGKTRLAYLLNGARLGGIGRQQATLRTGCSADIDGGAAVVGTTVYLPCLSGPIACVSRRRRRPCISAGARARAVARRSLPAIECGRSAKTVCSTGSTRRRAPYASARSWAYRPTTSPRRASGPACCLFRRRITLSPSERPPPVWRARSVRRRRPCRPESAGRLEGLWGASRPPPRLSPAPAGSHLGGGGRQHSTGALGTTHHRREARSSIDLPTGSRARWVKRPLTPSGPDAPPTGATAVPRHTSKRE